VDACVGVSGLAVFLAVMSQGGRVQCVVMVAVLSVDGCEQWWVLCWNCLPLLPWEGGLGQCVCGCGRVGVVCVRV